ncbi:hypothetical protein ABMY26_03960 [Azospirillum sp. HJ39]|uniref:hypothetical protein n=1 Tax=Azospirillum sp. HJ39 TaxID=3159496 RepID=UPI0035586536
MSTQDQGKASPLPVGPRRATARSWTLSSPLARAITATLLIKLCVVVTMRVFLFDGAHRPVIDASAMDSRLTASAPPR